MFTGCSISEFPKIIPRCFRHLKGKFRPACQAIAVVLIFLKDSSLFLAEKHLLSHSDTIN